MAKQIKRRFGWSRNIFPTRRPAPRKPEKVYERIEEERICVVDDNTLLSEINTRGYKFSELRVRSRLEYTIEFYVTKPVKTPNPKYASEYARWKREYKQWQGEAAAFEQEVKDWKAWCLQEEDKERKAKLAWARRILRENNKLPTSKKRK